MIFFSWIGVRLEFSVCKGPGHFGSTFAGIVGAKVTCSFRTFGGILDGCAVAASALGSGFVV